MQLLWNINQNTQGLPQNWGSFSLLSRRTCNTICQNSDKAHVFCRALPFQQASTNICIHQVHLKLQLILWKQLCICAYSKKKETKKMNENKFIHSRYLYLPRPHLTFYFSKYHPFVPKHASILSSYFLWWFQTPSECAQKSSGFLGSPWHLFRSSSHTVHISSTETTRIRKTSFNRVTVPLSIFLISHKI